MVVEDFGGLVVALGADLHLAVQLGVASLAGKDQQVFVPIIRDPLPEGGKGIVLDHDIAAGLEFERPAAPDGEQHFRDRELFIAAHGHAARPELVEIVDGEDGVPVVDRGISRSHLVGER